MSDKTELSIAPAAPPVRSAGAFSSMSAFEDAQRMARALCSSPLVPKEYQENLGSALIALELSQRMNMSPLMVMQNIDVIHGRPSWRSQMVIAAVNGCGRFSPIRYELSEPSNVAETVDYWVVEWKNNIKSRSKRSAVIHDRTCTAFAYDLANGERLPGPTVSIKMAVTEGWYGKSDSKWQSIPELMLRYRAASWWGRQYAPELLMGMPTADEARDIIDITPSSSVVDTAEPPPSRVASVAQTIRAAADKDASEKVGPKPEPAPERVESAPEWPKQDDDGIWRDSRGIPFMSSIHGMSVSGIPAVSKTGQFCKRRGCRPDVHAKMEADAMLALVEPPTADTREAAQEVAQATHEENDSVPRPGITYPEARSAIDRANSTDACDEALDLLREFDGPDDQAAELEALLTDRRMLVESYESAR